MRVRRARDRRVPIAAIDRITADGRKRGVRMRGSRIDSRLQLARRRVGEGAGQIIGGA